MNPLFPQGYDLQTTPHQYDEVGFRKTIKQQLERPTVRNLDREIQRRFVGLQLDLYENQGVYLGPGTGMRADNPEVATGKSYHQPIPYPGTGGARAIDTVGLPTHTQAWAAMQKGYLNKYGFASFAKGTNQFNYTGIPANVKDDPPHIQAYEDRYSRPSVVPPLRRWEINPRYDLDLINLDDPLPDVVFVPPSHEGADEVGFLIKDVDTGNYYSVAAGGISGVPSFEIRDALFGMGVITNKEPFPWSHADVMALLNSEDLKPPV